MANRRGAKEINPEYYSPLSSNTFENGVIGPGRSTFSIPKVSYSQETRDFVKLLMDETRLTTTQRRGFESLLRSNDPRPGASSTAFARRQEYMRRRVEKGRSIGLEVPSGLNVKIKQFRGRNSGGGKRSLETIKATSEVFQQDEQKQKTYIPVNKEAEKIRFSYKMSYGEEPSQEIVNHLMGITKPIQNKGKVERNDQELKEERLNELIEEIRDRVEFLETMKGAKKDKEYRNDMTYQIRQKLDEVKGQFPDKLKDLVHDLHLEEIDPVFSNI